ncbi:cyclic pyranopterin monophosphate synthase MoaC [Roseburia hominis]
MELTHFDENGKALMVDVTAKNDTERVATATGKITVSKEVYEAIENGTVGKGDVLGVATTAGIMGAKRTSELIPMCHILLLTNCRVRFEMVPEESAIYCFCTVKVTGKTGVEMEALTGVSVALLTVYDMCKAIDKSMEIGDIYLIRKIGGKSGEVKNANHRKVQELAEKLNIL